MTHTWDGHGTLVRLGAEDVDPGEEFEPTEAEKSHLGDQLQPVDDGSNPRDDGGEAGGTDADESEAPASDDAEDTPDLEALADEHWRTTVSAVEDGEVDGYLDDLAAIDDRESVQNAIAERQD